MIRLSRRLEATEIAGLALLSATAGLSLAYWPFATFAVLGALAILGVMLRAPRPLLILFMAFVIIQDPLRLVFRGDDTTVGFIVKRMDEALVFSMGAWVLISSKATQRAMQARGLWVAILGCYFAMITSSILAHVQLIPASMDLLLFSKPFALFAIGASLVLEPTEIRQGLPTVVTLMLLVVLSAVVFMAFPQLQDAYIGDIRRPDIRVGLVSAQGFFDGPGPYSWFCAATFGIAYAGYLAFSRRFYLYAAGLSGLFTLLAWRRKSILGVAAMLVFAILLQAGPSQRARLRAVVAIALVVLVGATVLAPYIGGLWQYTVTEYGSNPYATARFALHYTSLVIARDYFPFGSGLASFASHASRVYYSDLYYRYGLSNIWGLSPEYPEFITDTFWPMVLGEGGALGLFAYAMCFFLIVKGLWQAAKREDLVPEHRFLVISSLFLLVGSLSESTSSHIYDSTMQSALAMIPAGLSWSTLVAGVRDTSTLEPSGATHPQAWET